MAFLCITNNKNQLLFYKILDKNTSNNSDNILLSVGLAYSNTKDDNYKINSLVLNTGHKIIYVFDNKINSKENLEEFFEKIKKVLIEEILNPKLNKNMFNKNEICTKLNNIIEKYHKNI